MTNKCLLWFIHQIHLMCTVLPLSSVALTRYQSLKDLDSYFSSTKVIIPFTFSAYEERQEHYGCLCGKTEVTKDHTKDKYYSHMEKFLRW